MSRFIHIDSSIQSIGGHPFELACNLAKVATEKGWSSSIVTSTAFKDSIKNMAEMPDVSVIPSLECPASWRFSNSDSGGVRWEVNSQGLPIFSINPSKMIGSLSGLFRKPSIKETQSAFNATKKAFLEFLTHENLNKGDLVFFGTASEFDVLCYTEALKSFHSEISWNTVFYFHFGVFPSSNSSKFVPPVIRREILSSIFKRSFQGSLASNIKLTAITSQLTEQLTSISGQQCEHLNYPINERFFEKIASKTTKDQGPNTPKYEIALAGGFRDEQGSSEAVEVLSSIFCQPDIHDSVQLSMMVNESFPKNEIATSTGTFPASNIRGLVLKQFPLSQDDYFGWLADASACLFLYQPENYSNRISAVFLESLALGKPLVVLANSWMSQYLDSISRDYFENLMKSVNFSKLLKIPSKDSSEWALELEKPQSGQLVFVLDHKIQAANKIPTISLQIDSSSSKVHYSFRQISQTQIVCVTRPLSFSTLNISISDIDDEDASFTTTLNYGWIRSENPTPISSVGLVATSIDNFTTMVSELLDFQSHYRDSAKEARKIIVGSHHPRIFFSSLVDFSFC